MTNRESFTAGAWIEVTPLAENRNTPRDFGAIRGTATTDLGRLGYATFSMKLQAGGDNIQELHFNCNFVDVQVLFQPK